MTVEQATHPKSEDKAMADSKPTHVFEAAGLGKAPYRFVGVETDQDRAVMQRQREAAGLTFTTNHCTSCDYCSQAIHDAYRLRSADGKTFKVGCDCIRKAGDKGLIGQVDNTRKRLARERRRAREQKTIAEGRRWLEQNRHQLAQLPSLNQQRAAQFDETLLDQVEWFVRNAGKAGEIRMVAAARKALEQSKQSAGV